MRFERFGSPQSDNSSEKAQAEPELSDVLAALQEKQAAAQPRDEVRNTPEDEAMDEEFDPTLTTNLPPQAQQDLRETLRHYL